MAKDCEIENMTADALVYGSVIEIDTFNGGNKEYIAGDYRQPVLTAIFCGDCGEYLFENGVPSAGVDAMVREHLEV